MQAFLKVVVLAAMAYMHPGAKSAPVIADAIASTVARDCRGPGALGSCELDAIALAVSAEEEGRLCLGTDCLRGDQNRSSSTFQTMGATASLTELYERDIGAAARRAYAVLRSSAAQCPDEPLAGYTGGCHRRGARAIAAPRLALARMLLAIMPDRPAEVDLEELAGEP
jgi:hypothetical protein